MSGWTLLLRFLHWRDRDPWDEGLALYTYMERLICRNINLSFWNGSFFTKGMLISGRGTWNYPLGNHMIIMFPMKWSQTSNGTTPKEKETTRKLKLRITMNIQQQWFFHKIRMHTKIHQFVYPTSHLMLSWEDDWKQKSCKLLTKTHHIINNKRDNIKLPKTVDGSEIPFPTTGDGAKTLKPCKWYVNNGISITTFTSTGDLIPDFLIPSTAFVGENSTEGETAGPFCSFPPIESWNHLPRSGPPGWEIPMFGGEIRVVSSLGCDKQLYKQKNRP